MPLTKLVWEKLTSGWKVKLSFVMHSILKGESPHECEENYKSQTSSSICSIVISIKNITERNLKYEVVGHKQKR